MATKVPGQEDEYLRQVRQSISFIGQDIDYFTEVKAKRLLGLAQKHFGHTSQLTVLDIGCGVGLTDKYLVGSFNSLSGVDIDASTVENAQKANPSAHYELYDGNVLPCGDGSFDLVFAINVLHHVPVSSWPKLVKEMHRAVKHNGLVVIFEHNPLNPLTRLAVKRCPFDADAVLLGKSKLANLITQAGLTPVESSYIVFFPFRSKTLARVESRLGWLPLGAQHFVAGSKDSG